MSENGLGGQPTTPPGYQQPLQQMLPGQWIYQPLTPRAASSGLRIAGGVISIASGLWSSMPAFGSIALASYTFSSSGGPTYFGVISVVTAIVLVSCVLGSITAGIVLLARHRSRAKAAPISVAVFAALTLLPIVILRLMAPLLSIGCLLFGIATLALVGLALFEERRKPSPGLPQS